MLPTAGPRLCLHSSRALQSPSGGRGRPRQRKMLPLRCQKECTLETSMQPGWRPTGSCIEIPTVWGSGGARGEACKVPRSVCACCASRPPGGCKPFLPGDATLSQCHQQPSALFTKQASHTHTAHCILNLSSCRMPPKQMGEGRTIASALRCPNSRG